MVRKRRGGQRRKMEDRGVVDVTGVEPTGVDKAQNTTGVDPGGPEGDWDGDERAHLPETELRSRDTPPADSYLPDHPRPRPSACTHTPTNACL